MKNLSNWILFWGILLLGAAGCGDSSSPENGKSILPDPGTPGQGPGLQKIPGTGLVESADALAKKVFPDFQVVKMDPLDGLPTYQTTKANTFRRLQRKVPISSKVGRTYPRILLKMYEFASFEDLEKELNLWLSEMESSADSILLGQGVESVKSPPLLCAVDGTTFYMVQYACLYDGPEWNEDKQRFLEEMKAKGAEYIWQIKCGEGELVYDTKPEADPS